MTIDVSEFGFSFELEPVKIMMYGKLTKKEEILDHVKRNITDVPSDDVVILVCKKVNKKG